MGQIVELEDLGLCEYDKAWKIQTETHEELVQRKKGVLDYPNPCHKLILCEHPHVFTLGKSGKEEHLRIGESGLEQIQASFYRINRGGDITYHGPGQLVAYPILDLDHFRNDVHWYVRSLEEVVIRTLERYGLKGGRIAEYTGVWLDVDGQAPRKICAIGVHLSRWVSLHGLAFNIQTDLDYFNHIVPCGITRKGMTVTSMARELGCEVDFGEVKAEFIENFKEVFNIQIKSIS